MASSSVENWQVAYKSRLGPTGACISEFLSRKQEADGGQNQAARGE